jgi:hypothetical protein
LRENAFDMRTRFAFASRASEMYTVISAKYILPTIDKLPQLRHFDEGTDEVIESRLVALNKLRIEICTGTEQSTARASVNSTKPS